MHESIVGFPGCFREIRSSFSRRCMSRPEIPGRSERKSLSGDRILERRVVRFNACPSHPVAIILQADTRFPAFLSFAQRSTSPPCAAPRDSAEVQEVLTLS